MEHWFRAVFFKQEQEEGDDDDRRLFLSKYHYNLFIANAVGDDMLQAKRSGKNRGGAELYESYVMCGHMHFNKDWKVQSIINMKSLKSCF